MLPGCVVDVLLGFVVDVVVDDVVVEELDVVVVLRSWSTVQVNPPGESPAAATTFRCAFQNLSSDAGWLVLSTQAMPML